MDKDKSVGNSTSIIRKRLNFTDESLWKQFSSRRLQLVESLSLSCKKASEQDDEIKMCANTLLHEFNFNEKYLPDFDKLVRFAIQSVRRNKKRSQKRLANKLNIEIDNDNDNDSGIDLENYYNFNDEERIHEKEKENIPIKKVKVENNDFDDLINNDNNNKQIDIDSKIALNNLTSPIIPTDSDKLPSLKKLNEISEFNQSSKIILHAIKTSKTCFEISKNNNNNNIDNNNLKNYDLLEEFGSNCITTAVLFTLEKWFDHLLPDSSSYIKLRLKSDLTLSLIIKNLDQSSIEVNSLNNYVASQLFKKLIGGCVKDFGFNLILNPLCDIFHSIILKDYPIIKKDEKWKSNSSSTTSINYFDEKSLSSSTTNTNININTTTATTSSSKDRKNKQETPDYPLSTAHIPIPPPSDNNINLNSISIYNTNTNTKNSSPIDENDIHLKHQLPVLRSKQYINIIIKFKEKELKFRYSNDSNAPPTILELIMNCKQAFGIINSTKLLNLKDIKSNSIIKNDHQLEKLLNLLSILNNDSMNIELILELIYSNSTQGFLNLNHDNENIVKIDNPPPPKLKSDDLNSDSKNKKSSDSIISRYLPPPRPIRSDPTQRGPFLNFQPLL